MEMESNHCEKRSESLNNETVENQNQNCGDGQDENIRRKKKKRRKEKSDSAVIRDLRVEVEDVSGGEPALDFEAMPMHVEDELVDIRLKIVEEKLEKVSGALCNLEKEVFGGSKDKKPIISETQLEDHLLEGISNSGLYGCHRDLLCKFLVDAKGVNMNKYFRTRVLRVLKKLVASRQIVLCGSLYTMKK